MKITVLSSYILYQNLSIKKRDLPMRTDPYANYVRVIITLPRQPARRLTRADYQHVTANLGNIWETL